MKQIGKVVRINEQKKYGFIYSKQNDYFFHKDDFMGNFDNLINDLNRNIQTSVTFIPTDTPKGIRAINVVLS